MKQIAKKWLITELKKLLFKTEKTEVRKFYLEQDLKSLNFTLDKLNESEIILIKNLLEQI
tara:strand:+ start:774 stop:953 length:180 start_codon:yes stop_codon:yes gene_type:complete